jgi:hypothetical protein
VLFVGARWIVPPADADRERIRSHRGRGRAARCVCTPRRGVEPGMKLDLNIDYRGSAYVRGIVLDDNASTEDQIERLKRWFASTAVQVEILLEPRPLYQVSEGGAADADLVDLTCSCGVVCSSPREARQCRSYDPCWHERGPLKHTSSGVAPSMALSKTNGERLLRRVHEIAVDALREIVDEHGLHPDLVRRVSDAWLPTLTVSWDSDTWHVRDESGRYGHIDYSGLLTVEMIARGCREYLERRAARQLSEALRDA